MLVGWWWDAKLNDCINLHAKYFANIKNNLNFKLSGAHNELAMAWAKSYQTAALMDFLDYRLHCFWLLNFHLVWASGVPFLISALNYFMSMHLSRAQYNYFQPVGMRKLTSRQAFRESHCSAGRELASVCVSICGCFVCVSVSLFKGSRQSLRQQARKQTTCTWSSLKLNAPT